LPLIQFFSGQITSRPGRKGEKPHLLVVLLDHQYTQKSLDWNALKGRDRQLVKEFLANRDACELAFSLALIDVHEVREAMPESLSRHDYDDEDLEDEVLDDDNEEFIEERWEKAANRARRGTRRSKSPSKKKARIKTGDLIDIDYEVIYSKDEKGKGHKGFDILISEHHVVSLVDSQEFEPFDTEYEGYMGNWGETMESWYHRTALLVWPQSYSIYYEFLQSPSKTLKKLPNLWESTLLKQPDLLDLLAPEIIDYCNSQADRIPNEVLTLMERSESHEFALRIAKGIAAALLRPENVNKLEQTVKVLGEEWLKEAIFHCDRFEHDEFFEMIELLTPHLSDIEGFAESFISDLLKSALHALDSLSQSLASATPVTQVSRQEDLLKKFKILLTVLSRSAKDRQVVSTKLFSLISNYQNNFTGHVLSSWLVNVSKDASLRQRFESQIHALVHMTKLQLKKELNSLPPDKDWSIPIKNECTCQNCKVLNDFLRKSDLITLTLPLAKERRRHLHNTISLLGVPVSHETTRKGSPYQLVLTKLPCLHTERVKMRKLIEKTLQILS
jgi:hypothetical protein